MELQYTQMGSAHSREHESIYEKKLIVITEPHPSEYQQLGLTASEEELSNIFETQWADYKDVASEKFKNVFLYSQKNHPALLGRGKEFPSYFVVFETASWWWSIAKDNQYVLMQRSSTKNDVINYSYGNLNRFIQRVKYASSSGSVYTLIDWLHQKKLVSTPYDYSNNNSKHFADNIFNQFCDGQVHIESSCLIM